MPVVETKVFEQYEYQDYLITIQDHFGGPDLEGWAVPTRYAHLIQDIYDVYMSDEILESHGIQQFKKAYDEEYDEYYDEDLIPMLTFDPHDVIARIAGVKTDSSSSVLSFMVNELNSLLDLKPKTVVLKQIKKKSIIPKTSKNKRGFHQVAWASMVKLRDGKCTECGSIYDLHAHHIKPYKDYPELRHDVNNGITLCGQCHRKWHKENGK